jgi:hypothetical protein
MATFMQICQRQALSHSLTASSVRMNFAMGVITISMEVTYLPRICVCRKTWAQSLSLVYMSEAAAVWMWARSFQSLKLLRGELHPSIADTRTYNGSVCAINHEFTAQCGTHGMQSAPRARSSFKWYEYNINYVSYQKALAVLRVRALSWASGMCAHFKSDFARSGPTFYKPVIWSEHSLNYINQELFFCCGDRVEFARLRKCLQIVPLEDKIYVRCSDLESCEFCA